MARTIHPGGICDAVRITPRRRAERDRSHRRARTGEHVPWPTARRPGRWSSSSAATRGRHPRRAPRRRALRRRRDAGGSCCRRRGGRREVRCCSAFCGRPRGGRVLWGACDPSHAAPARAAGGHRRQAGGELGGSSARADTARVAAALLRELRARRRRPRPRGRPLGRRGDPRLLRFLGRRSARPAPRRRELPRRRARPRASAPVALGELRAASCGSVAPLSWARSRLAGPAALDAGAAPPDRRQPVLRDRGARGRRRAARDGARRRPRSGGRLADGCAARSTPSRSARGSSVAAPGVGTDRRRSTRASRGDPARRGRLVAFRHELARCDRGGALADRRAELHAPRSPRSRAPAARRIPPDSPTTPRRPPTPRPCCATRPRPASRGRARLAPRGGRPVRAGAPIRRRPRRGRAGRAARAPLVRVLPHRRDRGRDRGPQAALDVPARPATSRARATPALALAPRLVRGRQRGGRGRARRAVELLEKLRPGRELAMAYSNMAQLRMLRATTGRDAWGGGRSS